jgi:GntR family transcriptional repressor for pyruvate dehydrogenase complex
MPLTDDVINRLRGMIQSGELRPGSRLPPEPQLALQMGVSRSGVREAVKVLAAARVLDVRRGDGTYVTSLASDLLLEGVGFAFELLQGGESLLEVMEIRRLLEPASTAMAAMRMSAEQLAEVASVMGRMRAHTGDPEELLRLDITFHRLVIAAAGNATLATLVDGLSGRTARARVWRGIVMGNVAQATIDEHQAILSALESRDQLLAQSAALMHVSTSESWLRKILNDQDAAPINASLPPRRKSANRSRTPPRDVSV